MDLFEITRIAEENLKKGDLVFNENCERVLAILRSTGCVPVKRANQNGTLHRLISATIVTAHMLKECLYISTRKKSTYYDDGISTRFLEYLDNAVSKNLLFNKSRHKFATGNIHLGTLINRFVLTYTV